VPCQRLRQIVCKALHIDEDNLEVFRDLLGEEPPKSARSEAVPLFEVHTKGNYFMIRTHRDLDYFIASLKVPTYDKYKHYNYHDVLDALSKCVFEAQFR